MSRYKVDNDVLFKLARVGLLADLPGTLQPGQLVVLPACRFVAARALDDVPSELEELKRWLSGVDELEVTDDIALLAAEIEEAAIDAGLQLDGGESLLFAEAVVHGGHVVTGDKRAIAACDYVVRRDTRLSALAGVVFCLEQIMLWMLAGLGITRCRSSICRAKTVDRALTSCFHCAQDGESLEDAHYGLHSYIGALRKDSEMVLAADLCGICS